MSESDKLVIDELIVLLDDVVDSLIGATNQTKLRIIQNDLRALRTKLND
jgi:hypothetical protein